MKVACVIPTRNGKVEIERLLDSLDLQKTQIDVFVIDTESIDGTKEIAKNRVKGFFSVKQQEFNHGGTRQHVVSLRPEYEVYVFLTQDAWLADSLAITNLIEPFRDRNVAAVCGRQLPHADAGIFAEHARKFNYPDQYMVKTIQDSSVLGIKAAFMSNSFAAYRRDALDEVGGFPSHVIFAEDMYVAAKMLKRGWKVVYTNAAMAYHSHNYSIWDEGRRYFDMGVFHAREKWIRENFGGPGGEGLNYVVSELRFLGIRRIYMWPNALLRNAVKLIAFKLGEAEAYLPIFVKRRLGMHRAYWSSPFAARSAE